MTSPYIPPDDPGKYQWLYNFNAWVQAHGAAHDVSPAQLAELAARTDAFGDALLAHKAAQDAARAATLNKNALRDAAITLSRTLAQKLQHGLTMTNADRAAAGLTVPDTLRTPTDPDAVCQISPPLLLLDFGRRRQVTIHWGPNPGNEHENARPAATVGCQIHVARGGEPEDETGWKDLGIDTESPCLHHIEEETPTTFVYRARYLGKNLKYGPFGDPVSCTVSV